MLKAAQVGDRVEGLFSEGSGTGVIMLLIGFGIASLLKIAQGSSTVAMVTASAMLAAMGASAEMLGFHPVYLATAIAGGALVCSWMNDSGFWIFARMSVLTEVEALRSWTILLVVLGFTILGLTLAVSQVLPLI
jgi:GntP family gluconate:H+ symporter